MAEIDHVPEFLAAEQLGEMLIDMADRVATAHKVVPGARATFSFEMDGTVFQVALCVKPDHG